MAHVKNTLLLAALLGLAACAHTNAADKAGTTTTTTSGEVPVVLDDARICAIAQAMDQREIDEARLALRQSNVKGVQELATHMLMDSDATQSGLIAHARSAGIVFTESTISNDVRRDATERMKTLQNLSGYGFDRTYVDAQVSGHAKTLDMLDTVLIPQTLSPDLRATLVRMRQTALEHWQIARDLRLKL